MRLAAPTTPNRHSRRRTIGAVLTSIVLVVGFASPTHAIVRRRLNVNSNPQGALVYVDNQQIGTTPCSVDFTYYGTREIRLIKPGFETLTVNQPIPAPWYQYIPLDFISENLCTTKIRDNRTVNYNLSPQLVVPTQELIGRANELRQNTLQYGAPAAGPVLPVGAGPTPVITPGPPVALPPVVTPEPLPGVNPPTFNPVGPAAPVVVPQPAPALPPGGAPLLPPTR